jgi:SH3-like domain-containing protein
MLRLLALALLAAATFLPPSTPAFAQATGASGQPVPRFVSLRSDRVNVRQGPSRDHQVVWTFTRAALPVEITAEFENWRRIRDSEGSEGWVQTGLLSGRRTALVAPWRRGQSFDLHARAVTTSEVRARLESGVIVSARSCDGTWCRVTAERIDGFLRQEVMWGVYPGERFD